MGFLVSPGVEVKETDLTNIIPALATSVGGFAGFFRWGPVNTPVNVSSETELARLFGAPTSAGEYETSFLTAASYLKYSNALRVVRAADDSTNAYGGPAGFTTPASITPINTFEELSVNRASLEDADIRFVARYTGELGNSLGVAVIDNTTQNVDPLFKSVVSYTPNFTGWSDSKNKALDVYGEPIKDELTVVVYDRLGLITGVAGEILEVYQGLSYFTSAKNEFGQSIYWIDALNNRSSFVWGVAWDSDKSGQTAATYLAPSTYYGLDQTFQLENAVDSGSFISSQITEALDQLADSTSVDVNFIFAHNFVDEAKTDIIDDKLIDIVNDRRDAIAFISAPLRVASETSNATKKQAVLDKFSTINSTSYAIFDSSPVYVYNRYRDSFVWIPACGHIAGLCAKTDRLQDPWFSPAGFNRGNLLGVTKLAYNPGQTDRDDLYSARINPIVSAPGNGIVLFGDKTALSKPGAFDRINVRRLFITIEKAIATASKFLLFELNDEFTRAAFRNSVEPYLRDVQGRRGIVDFRVVCDESNNTPEVIDSNRFVGTIYIKPTKSINYITLNFVAVRTGVSFEEVIGTSSL